MFTGLIQALARVDAVEPTALGARLRIDPGDWHATPDPGQSVAVNGCCLTLVAGGEPLAFDVVRETLDRTTLGGLRPGAPVNLEPPLTPQTPIGGHFVQGHVDGVATVTHVDAPGDEWRVRIRTEPELTPLLFPKGSVAVDGVSLTLAAVDPDAHTFDVVLVPTTLERTTLGTLAAGHRVNIEVDMLAKAVAHLLRTDRPRP